MTGPIDATTIGVAAALNALHPRVAKKKAKHPDKKRTRKAKVASKAKKQAKKQPKKQEEPGIGTGFGFIERTAKPTVTGKSMTSRMVRIDGELADWMREEAKRANVSVTEVSRSIFQSLT